MPVCFPMPIDILQQLSDARIVRRCDHLFLSKASRTLNMANRLPWQLPVPAAATLLMCLLTQCTQVCPKEELWEAAKEEEMRIPWKEGRNRQYQNNSIKRDSGGEDWTELDWTH